METSKDLCEEKHNTINDKLKQHDKRLEEHDKQIDGLVRSDASNSTKIESLAAAIENQTKAIWGLVVSIIGSLGGFFIWYIQNH